MTLNSKVLSLVLLAGLTMGGTYAKKQKADWNNDSHSVKWSDEKCNASTNCSGDQPSTDKCCEKSCCSTLCDSDCSKAIECCADCTQPRCFRAYLSVNNVVRNVGTVSTPRIAPRTPAPNENKACGQVDLCFDKSLSKLCYRVILCNLDCEESNIPSVGQIGFYCLTPDEAPTSSINRPNNFDNEAAFIKNVTASSDGKVCITGSISQADITYSNGFIFGRATDVDCVNFIPLMYQAAMNFGFAAIYAPRVNGTVCTTDNITTSFSIRDGGSLRGTFIPCLPKCGS